MEFLVLAFASFFIGVVTGIRLGRSQDRREAVASALAKELAEIRSIPFPALDKGCQLPPDGWICTREPGHEGPCAAVQRGAKNFTHNGITFEGDPYQGDEVAYEVITRALKTGKPVVGSRQDDGSVQIRGIEQ